MAVPPILQVMISVIKKGMGLIFKRSVNVMVTGTISSTVVTLSRRADPTAVIRPNNANNGKGCPLVTCTAQIATASKTPLRRVMDTKIIMPISKPRVLKSISSLIATS